MLASPVMAAPYDDDIDDTEDGKPPFVLPKGADPLLGPVLPPLSKTMIADLFVSNKGPASIVYSKTLPDNIAWVEYDVDVGSVTLITWSGSQIPFGRAVPPQMGLKLRKLKWIRLARIPDGGIPDMIAEVPLVVRHIYKKTKPKTVTKG